MGSQLNIVIGIIVLFFLLREVFTWYIKQNKIVKQNDEIIRLLRKLANEPDEPMQTLFKKRILIHTGKIYWGL